MFLGEENSLSCNIGQPYLAYLTHIITEKEFSFIVDAVLFRAVGFYPFAEIYHQHCIVSVM